MHDVSFIDKSTCPSLRSFLSSHHPATTGIICIVSYLSFLLKTQVRTIRKEWHARKRVFIVTILRSLLRRKSVSFIVMTLTEITDF